MAEQVNGPIISPPSVGLRAMVGAGVFFTGVQPLSGPDPIRWLQGWQYEEGPCGDVIEQGGICYSERGFSPGKPTFQTGEAITMESQIQCSTYEDIEKLKEYAVQEFERQMFSKISAEIWSGTQTRALIAAGGAKYGANKWLARDNHPVNDVVILNGGTATTLVDGLAQLESALGACTLGGNGLIHVPRRVLTHMGVEGLLLDPTSGRRTTWNGYGVVAEDGYAGTGPAAVPSAPSTPSSGNVWIYATGPLMIKAAADLSGIQHVDVENNDLFAIVPGAYTYGWGCCHYAIQIDLV